MSGLDPGVGTIVALAASIEGTMAIEIDAMNMEMSCMVSFVFNVFPRSELTRRRL